MTDASRDNRSSTPGHDRDSAYGDMASGTHGIASNPMTDVMPPPLRPPLPLAKRLNRNVLTAAAVVVGLTALVVVTLVNPSGLRAPLQQGGPPVDATPTPARPSFFDLPPKLPHDTMPLDSAHATPPLGMPPRVSSPADSMVAPPLGATNTSGVSGPPQPSARAQAYQAALMSAIPIESRNLRALTTTAPAPLPVGTSTVAPPSAAAFTGAPASPFPAPSASPLGGLAPNMPPADLGPAGPGATPVGGSASGNTTAAPPASQPAAVPNAVPPTSGVAISNTASTSARSDRDHPVLRAGTVIPGFLVTAVSSDLPGDVLGQVSRDVYDAETEQVRLIPKGSRVIGTYNNREVGTGRLIVSWTRLIFPDGQSLALPNAAAKDETGMTGVHDQVDHHYGRIYGQALLVSAIGAGAELSQPQPSSAYAPLTGRQVAAGAVGQEFSDVALEQARRGMDIPPTLTIAQGHPFTIFLSADLVLDRDTGRVSQSDAVGGRTP